MSLIIFTLSDDTFTFSKGREYPVDDPVIVNAVTAYSAGKQLYAYNKGIKEQFFNLTFSGLNGDDYANVEDWITNISVGPVNTFTYTDESAAEHTVRCLDIKNPLQRVKYNCYNGTIHLRKEIT